MNKKILFAAAIVLIAVSAIWIGIHGNTYTLSFKAGTLGDDVSDFAVADDENGKVIRINDVRMEGDLLKIQIESVSRGKTYVEAMNKDGDGFADVVFVHGFGIITVGSFFGDSEGSRVIPAACAIYIILLLIYLIQKYRGDVRRDMYRYRNVLELGLIIFLCFILYTQINILTGPYRGLADSIEHLMNSANSFAIIILPIAFILSIIISLSNLKLMIREGWTWRNMLGVILGIMLLAGTLLPMTIGDILQQTNIINVHNEQGIGHFIETAVDCCSYAVIAYLECILAGTVIFGITAAMHVPERNLDYMLILGCAIKKDGTPTPLLKARADKAVEFSRRQKDETGKDLKFVPSGGKGEDEVISEAESISNYLAGLGIPSDRILLEDKSRNTEENIRNSMALIKEDFDGSDPKVGFSTTNYHVFRSGMIASRQGYRLEGVGSGTKAYFWMNAFIREYIATLSEEKWTHVKIITMLIALSLLIALINFLSIII